MDKESRLKEIFNDDLLGLLNVKPTASPVRNDQERLVAGFQEIADFVAANNREPAESSDINERQLFSRLDGLRASPLKIEMLKNYDKFNLLSLEKKTINSIEDIFEDDILGLLADDGSGLFDLKYIKKIEDRETTDFVARRKPCKDFDKYEARFKEIQADLKASKRKLVDFKLGNLKEGTFYVHNGVVFYLEQINISKKDHYKPDGTRVREDGRTRCIFENGTESNMLKRSVEKILYANGQVVTENEDVVASTFQNLEIEITPEDQKAGFIYILKSKSENPKIKEISYLYKIGFSNVPVKQRIKNAIQEPTYLMADVRIVMVYECYNMNPQKFEQLLHNFFGKACLNLDIFDPKGQRHTPREWFIAPLSVIEEAVKMIISGEIVGYRYDFEGEEIVKK
jgi:T5orf172 domain